MERANLSIRARPWPERPVSAANKSGNDTAATRRTLTRFGARLNWAATDSSVPGDPLAP